MKIYTRTGDEGTTDLASGERVAKTHRRVVVCGTIDEVNAALGAAKSLGPHSQIAPLLEKVQEQLFLLGSGIAASPKSKKPVPRIAASDTEWLEVTIDRITNELPPLRNFILPGGTPAAAQMHLARAICRRTEREAFALANEDSLEREVLTYLNRLSDFLFVLARYENLLQGIQEPIWRA